MRHTSCRSPTRTYGWGDTCRTCCGGRARLIVELDGKGAHTSAAQKHSDATKQEWLEARGYTVIRFTWEEVHFQPQLVAAAVRAALAQPRNSS
ncbi:MAG: DUF559 domain-containing protein [Solirubrobacterales bacterium]